MTEIGLKKIRVFKFVTEIVIKIE